ncbi:hypothetical protein N7501_001650 [Penicillium viridicatum]|nr:hypothetical protein N7501_001650 [Penicillium viridicatum]
MKALPPCSTAQKDPQKDEAMNQDNAPEAGHIIAEDNTQPSDNARNHTEALNEVRTRTKDEAAPSTKPLPKDKAAPTTKALLKTKLH